jgi:hypothetical protein
VSNCRQVILLQVGLHEWWTRDFRCRMGSGFPLESVSRPL